MKRRTANLHLVIIVCLFAAVSAGHYSALLFIFHGSGPDPVTEPVTVMLTRWLLLLPVIYAGIAFGVRGSLAAVVTSGLLLLGSIILSPTPLSALLATVILTAANILLLMLVVRRQSAQTNQARARRELEQAHQKLQHYIQSAQENEKRQNIFNAMATVLGESLQLEPVLNKATQLIATLMEAETALIYTLEENGAALTLIARQDINEVSAIPMESLSIELDDLGAALKSGRPRLLDDSRSFGDPMPAELGTRVMVPLVLHNQVSGALFLGWRHVRAFPVGDMDLLTAVGTQIATAIENAELYEKEKRSAQKLAVSERNYRQLFENASDAIWVHDLKGNITAVNRASEKIAGYTMQELLCMNVKQFLSLKSLTLAGRIKRRLVGKKPVKQPYVQRLRTKEGHDVILKLATSMVTENGQPVGFQHIARDVTQEVSRQSSLHSYLQEITKAQEEERKRIARELHDETAQSLYALNRQVDNFIRANMDLPPHNIAFLNNLGIQLRDILQSLRRFSQDLRPPMLDDLGLLATLRWLSSEMKEHHNLQVDLKVSGIEQRLPRDVEFTLFRIVQEALRNVEKHAQATRAIVMVEFTADKMTVAIHDNGKGFRLSTNSGDLIRKGKLGLAGMAERANLIDGELKITAAPGQGTTVTVEVSLQSPYDTIGPVIVNKKKS
jgi:PAS domain S-box-containing protein